MSASRAIDRLLPIALLLVMIAAAILLSRQEVWLRTRQQEITTLAMSRTHQMLSVRIDAMFHEWSEDLLEEAAAAEAMDSLSYRRLAWRWNSLIASHWTIRSIRLADERGNEIALHRTDSTRHAVLTTEGSKVQLPQAYRVLPDGSLDTVATDWAWYARYDPRERMWFSKAMENAREGPAWSLRQLGDTSNTVLQLSTLVHGRRSDDPFRVLMFDVEPARAEVLNSRTAATASHGLLLLTTDGRAVFTNQPDELGTMGPLLKEARAQWLSDPSRKNFTMTSRGGNYTVSVEPVLLNGLTLHACLVMDTEPLTIWTKPERVQHWIGIGVISLLALLLALLLWRGRVRKEEARKLAKHDKQLARRLEKAIGERDVLGREVHHRVKNNLQVVSSLLNLQAATQDDGPVRDEFLRGKRRIDTIALVHHKLYGLADLRNVDLKLFLTQLVEALAELNKERKNTVSVAVQTGGLKSDQDTAIELGIILCELVTNAYQHAFPHATGGHVEIFVEHVQGDLHRMVVRNNGVALQPGYDVGPGKLGLEIVDALAGQLDGSFHVRDQGGVSFEVLFRMRQQTAIEPVGADEE